MDPAETGARSKPCPGCGIVGTAVDGPIDPYGGASPSCWAAFQRVTVRDYGEFRYPEVHRLIVDAYMSQHPGYATSAGRRSVVVHLVGLCLALLRGVTGKAVGQIMARVFPDKGDIAALEPVPAAALGEVTVASLLDAPDLAAHSRLARTWAEAVWRAWTPFHSRVREWADRAAGIGTAGPATR